ncbi:Type II restriction endonuclease, TdeIII [Reichenbachiella faecimaris]|uniref:type II site-specific deoxyribonuclease n=1 Tax=Reichenbachiella faecimaris TaxID=692418 RepID=A0A1W2GAY2_REIFA|nr:TdeIII family type II restriction endonuclease [Reichenbachiella faecimaris]SMD33840.1 Type II restriction endonuclease, TdeIII [Reichenbachiella faecimaris]
MTEETRNKIETILESCVSRALERTANNKTHRPFHESLLTKELVNASSFERSFSTSFGQGRIEEISQLIAIDSGHESKRQKETRVNVFKGVIDEIERICSSLRSGEKAPNWNQEINKLQAYQKGDTEIRRVITDLWIKKDGIETFISIKTVKPNLDQTEIAKKDLLLLKAHDPDYQTYFGLFYNPGGPERKDYNWTIPSKIFNMKNDSVVLIGKDYWNRLGDSNTYKELLEVFAAVGQRTRKEILRLG